MVGRVALVTGGTRGIGGAISEALHLGGYKVAANYGGNEEKAKAFDGYTAYFGTYVVRETEGVVIHQRVGHLVPNQATLRVERQLQFLNDTLALGVPGGPRFVWKRAN